MNQLIKSISYYQDDIIDNILTLYVPSHQIDCDPTYSKGLFYKHTRIKQPIYKFDIKPQTPDTVMADARDLPLPDESLGCIMFDPPFLATTGKSLISKEDNNLLNRRFGVLSNEQQLFEFYNDCMKEFYRILKPDGILIFKCQDKVSSSKQYLSHVAIIQEAIQLGYYPIDLFVLLAKSRLTAQWQMKNQKHARKFHSYFLVFKKCNTKIRYFGEIENETT